MIVTAEQIERFSSLCQLGIGTKPRQGIGCLGEKILHVVLKQYLEPDPSFHEVKIGRYVADIARDSGVVEIQTRNFSALKKKLAAFLPHYPVTVVTPIPQIKWLSWIEEQTGEVTKKRKSPKTGTALDVFRELYHIREFLLHPHFQIQLIFLEVEEYRLLNGWGNGGKRGSTRYDRIPIRLLGERFLRDREDYRQVLPVGLPEIFTSSHLAQAARLSPNSASRAMNVFFSVQAVGRVGKQGNHYCYRVLEENRLFGALSSGSVDGEKSDKRERF